MSTSVVVLQSMLLGLHPSELAVTIDALLFFGNRQETELDKSVDKLQQSLVQVNTEVNLHASETLRVSYHCSPTVTPTIPTLTLF